MFFNGHRIDSTVHPEGLECIGTDPNVIFFPVAGFEIWGKKKKTTQNAGFLFAVFLLCCFVDGSYQFFFSPLFLNSHKCGQAIRKLGLTFNISLLFPCHELFLNILKR